MALGTVAALLMAGWSLSSQAQTCTITNWGGGAVAPAQLFAGTPADGNSRYAGPCSMELTLANQLSYVVDDTPSGEQNYIARFYFNPNGNNNSNLPMVIFAANDGAGGSGNDVVQVWYNVANAAPFTTQPGHITVVVQTDTGVQQIQAGATGVRANGWNSVEIVWAAAASANIVLNINGQEDRVLAGVNTSTQRVQSALMGLVGIPDGFTVSSANPMFFDDFDSRRQTRPGRLCRGLTDESREALLIADAQAIFGEASSGGVSLAAGTPDFNEDGGVTIADSQAVFSRVSTGLNSCDQNS